MAVSTSTDLLPTEEYNDEALRKAFVELAPAAVDDMLSDVTEDNRAPSEDILQRALEDASVNAKVVDLAYEKLITGLHSARSRHSHASPSLVALLHGQRGDGSTCAYSDASLHSPEFASVVYLDHTPKLLLSCHPDFGKEQYIASLWHHNVSVAVSLQKSEGVWPEEPHQSRTFGMVQLTAVSMRAGTDKGLPKGVTESTVRLRHDNGEERCISVWNVPWPDFDVLHRSVLTKIARDIRSAGEAAPNSTIAIHCFGGQGRSGTLALTIALQCQRRRPITLAAALRALLQLRIQRRNTVESGSQFFSAIQSATPSSTADA